MGTAAFSLGHHTRIRAPMSRADDLIRLSVLELAQLVRDQTCSPRELVDAHIARIEAVNPHLNAMVAPRFEAARAEANAADDLLLKTPAEELPPLFGVPFTAKEFFAAEGMPWTGGILHRKGVRAERDAVCVARLRAAGAILLGLTNVPEGGLWMETTNAIYGRTHNPCDTRWTPGGSSGGEAALVAAGASPIGLASDVGGSIRIPAFMCGVVGHKPSGRLIPNAGQFPGAKGLADAYLGSGPIGRTVSDMMPLLRVLAGPHPDAPLVRPQVLGDPADVDLSGLRLHVLASDGRTMVGPAIRGTLREARDVLIERGATLHELRLPRLRHSLEIWSSMLHEGNDQLYEEMLGKDGELRLLRELLAFPFRRSGHTFAALVVAISDRFTRAMPSLMEHWVAEGEALKREFDAALGNDGVLLYPPYTRPAPRHWDPWRTPFDWVCTAIFNVLESPGTVVPTTKTPDGRPLGVQLLGAQGQDHLCLAAAQAIESHFGRWDPIAPRRKGKLLIKAVKRPSHLASSHSASQTPPHS